MTEEQKSCCPACGSPQTFTSCSGCGKPFCEKCLKMEIQGSGCGCVWVVYYCYECVGDERLNPNAPLRSDLCADVGSPSAAC